MGKTLVTLRVDDEQLVAWKEQAWQEHKSLSRWIREKCGFEHLDSVRASNMWPCRTALAYVTAEQREMIFTRDGFACLKCGSTGQLVIDHIQPLALGGSDDDDNLQTLCKRCNSEKSASFADFRV